MRASKPHTPTLGTMISSAVFVGMGLWLLSEAFDPALSTWNKCGLILCAVACFLASARYRIGMWWAAREEARYGSDPRDRSARR